MSGSFAVTADTERDTDYDIHDNALVDVVNFSRAKQVQNEAQAAVLMMGAVTGLLDDYKDYTSIIVTGSASSGKSHMLDEVMLKIFQYADEQHESEHGNPFVYQLTGGSDQAGINDPAIDDSWLAYFSELQKIPDEFLEFVKTISEDGQFRYGRSQADPDAEGGFSTEHLERDPLPVIFSFADENTAQAGKDQELRSRTVEVKVDESPEKNAAVHRMKWGETRISLPDSDQEYIFEDEDMEHEVKAHVRDMPKNVNVVLPTNDQRFDGDDWSAPDVTKPLFNFARPDSTRASALLAGLTKGSALWNYHNRDAVCTNCWRRQRGSVARDEGYECPNCEDEDLYIVAEPQDVGNLLACRQVLLATTHGMTDKKFAVLDALREAGGRADKSGKAVQATKQSIVEQIQRDDDIGTMTDSEITDILDQLDEHLIINKTTNPEDRRENLYIYDGGQAWDAPNIADYYEHFEDVTNPITGQPIEVSIEEHLKSLNARTDSDTLFEAAESAGEASEDAEGTLSAFGEGGGGNPSDLPEVEQRVAERLQSTLSGMVVPDDAADELDTPHMIGEAPVVKDGDYVRPERPSSARDTTEGMLNPDYDLWDEGMTFDEIRDRVDQAIETLLDEGVFMMEPQDDGRLVTVNV